MKITRTAAIRFFTGLLIAFTAFTGCRPPIPEQQVAADFKVHRAKYEYIRSFFANNPYEIRDLSYSEGKWTVHNKDEYKTWLHKKGMLPGKDIDTLLSDFDSLRIFSANGDSLFLEVHFNHSMTNCRILRYDKTPEKYIDINRKIDSLYVNPKNHFWFIRVDSCWYFERVKCLSI